MFDRLQSRTRAILAMCCMALMAVLAAQGAITNVDRTQHALGVEHAPIPMAGAVHFDHDDHHQGVSGDVPESADPIPDDDDGRPAHHHYAEGPQMAALSADRLPELMVARLAAVAVPRLDSPALLVTLRLERPPKATSKSLA
ncbi:hypothetical protein M9M90_13535 [Phenylobacterium sp. LH3H17]|uniref:hypothetical protein n=1 Tax=Phenylobacterium sp. LH3H17 TaxID=2903901 RepID=UPI0020C95EDB|nr:hypothetical protein [Phenylobacterium sp. LH3H17]UTP38238.1 hypothetical protein M9M90_13535 [Phenylobacterium sp. LH3H17]